MNTTINLAESLLVKGRNLHQLGIAPKALHLLNRLSGFRNLPEHVARETRLRLAQLYCKQKNYRRARRLLAQLAQTEPEQPHHDYLLGRAAAADVRCDPRLALRHYRRCLRLDPHNARYLSAFGMLALGNGRERSALRTLRRAFRLAPTDAVVVRRYLRALRELRRLREARRVLHVSRFRLGKEVWFQNLATEFRFFVLHARQRRQQRRRVVESQQCLLPFPVRLWQATPSDEAEFTRHDGPAVLPAPHLTQPRRRSDQRHAQ
jgi:predicted Zn-dependent protease